MTDDRRDELERRLAGPEWEQQRQFLTNPLIRGMARLAGVDLSDIDKQSAELDKNLDSLFEATLQFAGFGWYVSERNLRASDYTEAVAIWEQTHDQARVDEHLTNAWRDLTWLRHSYGPITTLGGRHEATHDVLRARRRMINKAVDHHMKGEYEAAVLILLSQIDGLTFDFTEGKYGFFFRGKDPFFEDDQTLAGMPEFLRAVRKAVNRDGKGAPFATALHRHAILHGRYVAFGTETNAAKAFALLSGVLDWLQPKADELTEQRQVEHEARHAGSTERDDDGRLMDRRGFADTRDWLRFLAIRQTNEHRKNGRYNDDLRAMFPHGRPSRMERLARTTLTVAPDGQSFWASCPSDTDVVFGLGARDGEAFSHLYVDVGPPGALGEDSRWISELDDLAPDWTS
jgi:hypothetical protein